jgi:4'-phosphopantetheinyl transferase
MGWTKSAGHHSRLERSRHRPTRRDRTAAEENRVDLPWRWGSSTVTLRHRPLFSLPMPEHEVHVWRANLDQAGWPSADDLPAVERRRARRLRGERVRQRWAASRWALRRVLAHYLDKDPAVVDLRSGLSGKPILADSAVGLHFNLSHSSDMALIAVAGIEVGVDVERITSRRNLHRLARRVLDLPAAMAVMTAPANEQTAAFYRAWTMMEAIAKCHGGGLAESSPAPRAAVIELDVGPRFAAALALPHPPMLPLRRLDMNAAAP